MEVKFRIRRDTASNWASLNPTLALGEPGLETNTRKVKYGDGSTQWNSLAYTAPDLSTLGTASTLAADTDTTLAANSDTRVATQKAVKAYVTAMVAGLLDFKGNISATANPNYSVALKGDAYYISAAGKIGGASGKTVEIGDVVVASADNAGGTEASVGTSWFVLEHNLVGALLTANNLSDVANAPTARGNLGAQEALAAIATNVGIGRAVAASKLDVNGSVAVVDSGFAYTPYNGATNTSTVRAGIQFDGTNQTINNYTANAYRGGRDASGNERPGSDNLASNGTAGARWSVIYAGTGAINTSDRRNKKSIGPIPEAWLDAWSEVEWCRFKFRGGGKRWHVGLIAQDVHAAFDRHGLDAFAIGLCCYDEWDDEHIPLMGKDGPVEGKTQLVRKAGNRWGLRYDECQGIEAAWQRREITRLQQRIALIAGDN